MEDGRCNIHGGCIALGHPLGSSGARIVTTRVHAMKQQDAPGAGWRRSAWAWARRSR
ncbi:hypothetical protein [Myxococcus xanthus]|uniref:hypothetical protein n=1 Tax=Myxococcus xanthus TaxID=34 RepID=UPI0021F17C6C|nr:hypothetical protein [Myxococcus xanthus]